MQLTQPQPNSKQKPSIGLFLLYIFVAAALIIFIGYPKYSDYRTVSTHLTADTQALAQTQASAAEVQKEIGSLQAADVSKISAAIPSSPNLPDLYAQVESLANAATVHLVSIQGIIDSEGDDSSNGAIGTSLSSPTTAAVQTQTDSSGNPIPAGPIKVPTVPSSLGTISLNVDVSGSYSAVQQFLSSLYTSLRIVTVQQTVMSTGKSGAQTGGVGATSANAPTSIDLKVQMQTYYSK